MAREPRHARTPPVIVAFLVLIVAAPLLSTGSVAASTPTSATHTGFRPADSGPPTAPCGITTPDGSFAILYYAALLGATNFCSGSFVFGDLLYVEFINDQGNRTIHVTSVQNGTLKLYQNGSFDVTHGFTVFSFSLPSTTSARDTYLCIDGGCFGFTHQTPLTLIPSGILNVGGLDILVLVMVIEFGAVAMPTVLVARYLNKKAVGFLPKFRAWLWGPHVLLGLTLLIVADFQAFDAFLGGLGFVTFPIIFDGLFFGWMLDKFNSASWAEVLRPDPQGGHRLRYNRWRIVVGELPDGTKVLCGRKWRDALARWCGHYPILSHAKSKTTLLGAPTVSAIDNRRAGFRVRPKRGSPLDDFEIAGQITSGEKNPPKFLYWVDHDGWLSGEMPHLSIHRTVEVPPRLDPETGNVVRDAFPKKKLAWPHYVDPPDAEAQLAGFHYQDTPVQAIGWVSVENANRRLAKVRMEANALRMNEYRVADEMAQEQVSEMLRFYERERTPLTDAEAEEEARSKPSAAPTPKREESTERPAAVGAKKMRPEP